MANIFYIYGQAIETEKFASRYYLDANGNGFSTSRDVC